jgi:hypothetical protein
VVAVVALSGAVKVPFIALLQLPSREQLTIALQLTTVHVVAVVVEAAWQWRSVFSVELVVLGLLLALGPVVLRLWVIVRRGSEVSVGPSVWRLPAARLPKTATEVLVEDSHYVGAIFGPKLITFGAIRARRVLVGTRNHG